MAAGDRFRRLPDNSIKDVNRSLPPESSGDLPADSRPNSPRVGAPRQPGRQNGPNLGVVDHFDALVRLGGAGGFNQIRAVHESPFVRRDTTPPGGPNDPDLSGFTYGSLADFDWVEDNLFLALAGGKADNYPGVDSLEWEIPIADLGAPDHTRHDHTGLWAGNEPEITLGRFRGDFFRTVDVISQILRYADLDARDGNGDAREAALDYSIQFSAPMGEIGLIQSAISRLMCLYLDGRAPRTLIIGGHDGFRRWMPVSSVSGLWTWASMVTTATSKLTLSLPPPSSPSPFLNRPPSCCLAWASSPCRSMAGNEEEDFHVQTAETFTANLTETERTALGKIAAEMRSALTIFTFMNSWNNFLWLRVVLREARANTRCPGDWRE